MARHLMSAPKNSAMAARPWSANAAKESRTTSTFSSDIAYSDSPTAARASFLFTKLWNRRTFPSRMTQTQPA